MDNFNLYFAKKALLTARKPIDPSLTTEILSYLTTLMQAFREGNLCMSLPDHPLLPFELQKISYIVIEGNRCYLQKAWTYETHLWKELCRLRATAAPDNLQREELLHTLQQLIEDKTLLPLQAKAIHESLDRQILCLSGGPGTGKSYTASWLAKLFHRFSRHTPFHIAVTAPTGKAASHLHSLLTAQGIPHLQSGTLHQLLHLHPGEEKLGKPTLIQADLLLVDEASMLDVTLLAHLLQAISPATRLVLLGDAHQLPPIGAGTLFADIADAMALFLTTTLRTEDTTLQNFAHAIRQNNASAMEDLLLYSERSKTVNLAAPSISNAEKNPALLYEPWPDRLTDWLATMANEFPPLVFAHPPDPQECLKAWESIRILSPFRQGPFGLEALHQILYRTLQANCQPGHFWALPILLTKNEPNLGLYNGTQGIVVGKEENLRENFKDLQGSWAYLGTSTSELRKIPFELLPDPELALCLSIHKSQGSEFHKVVALFPPGSEVFGNEALYTAITRSKKTVRIVAPLSTLKEMVSRNFRKRSGLKDRFMDWISRSSRSEDNSPHRLL